MRRGWRLAKTRHWGTCVAVAGSVLFLVGAFPAAARLSAVQRTMKASGPATAAKASHRIGLRLTLVRRSTFLASGVVKPARGLSRLAVELRYQSRWVPARRNVKIGRTGSFTARFRAPHGVSKVTVRVVAIARGGKQVATAAKTLQLGSDGSAAFSVPTTTRVYPGAAVRSASVGPAGETILQLAPNSAKPVVGGHVALGPSAALPFGMFGTVAGVSQSLSRWRVALTSASIDQVFEDVSTHFDQDVTPRLVDAFGHPTASASRAGTIRISGGASFAHSASLNSVFECKSSGKPEAADLGFSSVGPMPISIELSDLHALDQFDLGSIFPHRDPFFLMQVRGEAQATIGFEAKTSFSCTLSNSFRENHRIAIPLGAVGPVPVTMYLEPTLSFSVSESGKVSLSQHHYWAITLEQNGFAPFRANLAHSADPAKINMSAALGASLFAGGDLSVMFGAGEGDWAVQAGIYGEFGPDFEVAAGTDHPGCVTATAKLEAKLGVRLQVLAKRWSAQLASLTTHPVYLGGPWCVGGGSGGGAGSGGGSGGGGNSSSGGGDSSGGGGTVGGKSYDKVTPLAPTSGPAGYAFSLGGPDCVGNAGEKATVRQRVGIDTGYAEAPGELIGWRIYVNTWGFAVGHYEARVECVVSSGAKERIVWSEPLAFTVTAPPRSVLLGTPPASLGGGVVFLTGASAGSDPCPSFPPLVVASVAYFPGFPAERGGSVEYGVRIEPPVSAAEVAIPLPSYVSSGDAGAAWAICDYSAPGEVSSSAFPAAEFWYERTSYNVS